MEMTKNKAASSVEEILSKRITKEDLLELLSPEAKASKVARAVAAELLESSYETALRFIRTRAPDGKRYGNAFQYNPEILAYVMKNFRGKRALELGACRGENGLLMGLAGAETTINDINATELAEAAHAIEQLPLEMQHTISLVAGDCLTAFEHPRFTESCDVIMARNLFHYFVGAKREELVKLVHRLLKPGGTLILSVNSALVTEFKEAMKDAPDAYVFHKAQPAFAPRFVPTFGQGDVTVVEDPSAIDIMAFSAVPAVKFQPDGIELQKGFSMLSKKAQEATLAFAQEMEQLNGYETLKASGLHIQTHICYNACYTRRTIQTPFIHAGFSYVAGFSTDKLGHVTANTDEEASLTVIFVKTSSSSTDSAPTEHLVKRIDANRCAFCNKEPVSLQQCSACKKAFYCDKMCQASHWQEHKKECKKK